MLWVNALGRLSCRARRSQPGSKREMRTSAMAQEKVFPRQLPKEMVKDSGSDWELGKEQCFPNDAMGRSRPRFLLPAFRSAHRSCPSQEGQMASQPFPGK